MARPSATAPRRGRAPVPLLALIPFLPVNPQPLEAMLELHGWGRPARDARLDAAAAVVARRLAGPPDAAPPEDAYAHLRFVLSAERVGDALVYPFTVRHLKPEVVADRLPALLARLDRRRPPTHYGLATHGQPQGLTTTLLLVHRGVTLKRQPPHTLATGTRFTLEGALRPGYFRPRLLVDPPGSRPVRERPAWGHEGGVEITVFFDDGPGRYAVELVADSQYGPVVLYNQGVYAGVDPPALPEVPVVAGAAQRDPQALWRQINEVRRVHGQKPLAWHAALADAARVHAEELADRKALDHLSPDTGWLTTRLADRGVPFTAVAENLALAPDVGAALKAFLESPGHKRNLLGAGLTHVGIGRVGSVYVVAFARLEGR